MKRFLAIICIVGMLLLAGTAVAENNSAGESIIYSEPYVTFIYSESYGIEYLITDEFDINFMNYVLWFNSDGSYFLSIMPMNGSMPSYELENWYTAGSVFVDILNHGGNYGAAIRN